MVDGVLWHFSNFRTVVSTSCLLVLVEVPFWSVCDDEPPVFALLKFPFLFRIFCVF